MQELIPAKSSLLSPGPIWQRRQDRDQELYLTEIQEAANDIFELQHLTASISINDSDGSILDESFHIRIQALAAKQLRQLDLIERASRWGKAKEISSLLQATRKEYLKTKSLLRVAYRQLGQILCAFDWQSPVYSSSLTLESNRLTKGISEHSLDYKRDGHLDALVYEQAFVQEYLAPAQPDRVKGYLANSGMAAFTTVLHWIAHEQPLSGSILALQPMYFENLHLIQAVFPDAVQLETPSQEHLLAYLRAEQPSTIFCDAVTNCGQVLTHDFELILKWACTEARHNLSIIIDTTCLPSAFLRAELLQRVPEHISILFVESLAKHHQLGMDIVTAGITIACMRPELQDSFRKTRARLGTNITDSSVGSLPKPDRVIFTKRMRRHSRNVRLLAEGLETQIKKAENGIAENGVIESVSWLNEGSPSCPWFYGSCLTIRLHKNYRSIHFYRQFEQRVMELCRQADVAISFGTSFGFDVTRLYVTAPATRFEEPFLRIAVGTETKADIECLLENIKRASSELKNTRQAQDPEVASTELTRADQPFFSKVTVDLIEQPEQPIEKPGLHASVYVGEDGLKNYLTPANYAPTPLVELPSDLNPFREDGVRIFAKMVPLVPLMNIKSIPAFSMLSKAAERGDLEGVKNLIESSSSNTALSLSVIGKLFGIDSTCAIVDHSIAPSLVRMLRLFGIEIFLHPAAGHELFGKLEARSQRASNQGQEPGWLNPGQYTNPDNPEGFARWLAPDLWNQTAGKLSVLSCGLGTCGTMVGVSHGLRQYNPNLTVVACCPQAGHAVPGPREKSLLADVSFPWQSVPNATIELPATKSFAGSIKLLRRGILGGPSSGMNYIGLLNYLQQEKDSGRLQQKVQSQGELWSVFLCCDSPLPHVDEYYDELGDEYFPTIHPVPNVNCANPE